MKPSGNALTLTVGRRENTHFQKPLSNGTPVLVPKLLNIWLITHRSHGTLAFTDASDLPKPLEQIPMWTPLLKTTPARISCAVCFNSDWNSGFTSQVWTEGLHIKNCGGKGCICTRSAMRSIRGQSIWFVQELAMSFRSGIAPLELALVVKTMSS